MRNSKFLRERRKSPGPAGGFAYAFLIIAEIRDFLREAVFCLRSPVLTDLSKIFWTFGIMARASFIFFSLTSFLTSFTALFINSFLAMLNPLLRLEDLRAFLADCVMGMMRKILP